MKINAVGGKDLIFLPLGGAGEIGMNLNLYGHGGKWLMADLGMTFADESLPGIDLVFPDPAFIAGERDNLVGLVVTHAHEDHIGAVPYLWPQLRCPVYATPFAAAMLHIKLAEAGLLEEVPLHVVKIGGTIDLDPFRVTYIQMTHSIPEPMALAIETPAGLVIHSGDWKIDAGPLIGNIADQAALQAYGDRGVLALVCDSTNAPTAGWSGSEAGLEASLSDIVGTKRGRVVVTTFASNVARIQTIAAVAAANDRQVCVVGRSLWRTIEVARECGYLKGVKPFLTERDVGYMPSEKVLLLCTGCQGEPRGAMWRIASGQHAHVSLSAGDTVIFSSKMIPGNERVLSRLHNRLIEDGIEVVTEKDANIHVSGHPYRDELAELYRWVRPRIVVPVHGEIRHMEAQAQLARDCGVPEVVRIRNGDLVCLAPGPARVEGQVPTGRQVLDGGALVRPDGAILQERRRLMYNGAVFVTVVMGLSGQGIEEVMVSLLGVPEKEQGEPLADDVAGAVAEAVSGLSRRKRADDGAVEETVRRVARRAVKQACGKRPVIEVQIVRPASNDASVQSSEEEALA